MAAVGEHGETSLVFVGGELSHVLRKVIGEISERFDTPLYARVDLVADRQGAPVLLELGCARPRGCGVGGAMSSRCYHW